MKAKLTTAQVMSLYSGFAYCAGRKIGDALGFMIGDKDPPLIAGLDFHACRSGVLLDQFPWLEQEAPMRPFDWRQTLEDAENKHGKELEVVCCQEHLYHSDAPHPVPAAIQVL